MRADLDKRLTEVEAELDDEHLEGYLDGRDLDCPDPNPNRSAAYRHSFAVGRAERKDRVRPAVLLRMEAQQIATTERVKIMTGERY